MPSFPNNPLLDTFVTAHGAVVKGPASFARKVVKDHIQQTWGLDIDPDTTRLMAFSFSAPPASEPYPATVLSSMTLTEAMLHNYHRRLTWFNGFGYVAPFKAGGVKLRLADELLKNFPIHVAEGLYRRSTPQLYDASTHVDLRPADFKAFVKNANLRSRYQAYLKSFWSDNAQHCPVLAKAAFIKAAFLQARENSLSEADRQLALRALGLPASQAWSALTPDQLRAAVSTDTALRIAPLKIHRYSSTDILVIKDTLTSRVLLYIPGNSSPLQGFVSEQVMAQWLAEQCRDPRKRLAFEAHFKDRDDHDGLFLSGLQTALKGVAVYPYRLNAVTGSWPPRHFIHSGVAVSGDPFIFVRNNVQQRLSSDAKSLIRSHGDERLEGITDGLSKSLMLAGLVALIVPAVVPLIVGLSITLIGTAVVQTVQGKTAEQRLLGLQRVEFGLLNAAPLAAGKLFEALAEVGASVETVEPAAAGEQQGAGASLPVQVETEQTVRPRFEYEPPALRALGVPLRTSLREFEAPAASVRGTSTIHGPNGLLDIHHNDGRYFLSIHDRAYEVRWQGIARRWQIISPDGSGKTGPFVRQLESDQWDIDEGGLKGGMEPGAELPGSEPVAGPSLHAQVKVLYPRFNAQQVADLINELRANGTSIEIQLARLAQDFKSLQASLERWISGPLSGASMMDAFNVSVSRGARRRAADIIKRCWQRQTPVEGDATRHLSGYLLNLSGIPMGDLPYLPGDFSHVTAINLARTYVSHQSVSALVLKCPELRWLNAENNFLPVVPAGIRNVPYLTRLTLSSNNIVLTPDMVASLGRLSNLRLLNLEYNPLGPLLDLTGLPQLLNVFLRNTGITSLPTGVCEVSNLLALDLRSNLISTFPEAFFARPELPQHTLFNGNPLSLETRIRLAWTGVSDISDTQGESVEFWLEQTPNVDRDRRRGIWRLFWTQEHSIDFFEVIARLDSSADFNLNRAAVTERVWQVLEAGADDPALRARLVAMAAHPETCVDGTAVMFSNMELEVLVSNARSRAVAGREGPQLLKLVRGLYRLEEVDAIARLDAIARADFDEDIEVQLAYRVGLVNRLELPLGTRVMQFSSVANVSQEAIDAAAQRVLQEETPEALSEFALSREFWVDYLRHQYADSFLVCQQPTALRMEALDDQQSLQPLTDAVYKQAAEAIVRQRQLDEAHLMKQLTQAELAGGPAANEV